MKNIKALLRERRWDLAFAFMLAAIFLYVALRHVWSYPSVFADEQIYSRFARLVPLHEVTIPSYLYLAVYGTTTACGDSFLDCARILNLLFFIGSAPFIYLTTRRFAPKPLAMLAALLCVAAPTGTYTAYFMPESMYFFGFAVLTWLALTRSHLHWAAWAALTGAVLGLMTLVKVHALFLVPALAVFMLYMGWSRKGGVSGLWTGLAAALVSVIAVFAVKFAVGYAMVGTAGLQVLGSFYASQANDGVSAGTTILTLLPAAWFSLKGHLMLLALVFGLPIAGVVFHGLSREARANADRDVSALMVYSALMLAAALALTVFYTASTAGFGPFDGKRLHARYYTFALILPVMIAAARTGTSWRNAPSPLPWLLAGLLWAAIVYATHALPADYLFLLADGPEIVALGLGQPDTLAPFVVAAAIGVLVVWAISRRLGALAFLLVFMPLFLFNGERMMSPTIEQAHIGNAYDRAGQYAYDHLTAEQRNDLRVAGDNYGELLRALFYVDAAGADTMVLPHGWKIEPYSIHGRKSWLLVVGDYELPKGVVPAYQTSEFALVPTRSDNRSIGAATFNGPLDNGVLAGAVGLAGAEGWGRWSNGDQVRLHFREALPRRVNLFLTMQAFGPNVGKEFVVRVGQAEKRVKLAPRPHEVFLEFETDGMQRTVTIDVPQAVSPKELGMSGDVRRLGVGLVKVEIGVPGR